MAFIFDNFTSVGQKINLSPNSYAYKTTDLLTTTRADGYFDDPRLDLNVNDTIFCSALNAAITFSVVSLNPLVMRKVTGLDYAEHHLPITPETVVLNDDGVTYTKITSMTLSKNQGFFDNGDGSIKKINNSARFLFVGTSDVKSNKGVDLTYALFVNDVAAPDQKTLASISSAAKYTNVAITSIPDVAINDKLDVRVKGDGTVGVTLTINKLDVTLVEL